MTSAPQLVTKLFQEIDKDETQLLPMASQLTNKKFYDRCCELSDTTKLWCIKLFVWYPSWICVTKMKHQSTTSMEWIFLFYLN